MLQKGHLKWATLGLLHYTWKASYVCLQLPYTSIPSCMLLATYGYAIPTTTSTSYPLYAISLPQPLHTLSKPLLLKLTSTFISNLAGRSWKEDISKALLISRISIESLLCVQIERWGHSGGLAHWQTFSRYILHVHHNFDLHASQQALRDVQNHHLLE